MSKSNSVVILKNFSKPKKAGFYKYLVCLTGENKGISYYFTSKRIIMGRSENADIQVLDGRSSREHAELKLISDLYIITDLGSHNGITVNDLKISQHQLVTGDNIIIGQTVYKYQELEVEEAKELVVQEKDEEVESSDTIVVKGKDSKKGTAKVKSDKKRKLILVAVAAAVVMMFIPSGNKKKKKKKKVTNKSLEEMSISKPVVYEIEDKDVRDKLNAFIHRGQREYRERNFFRAIEQFEMALILVPNHGQSSFYLRKSQDSLRAYIKKMEEKATRETASLRYKAAMNQYCSIISFLQNYVEDERYIRAEKNIAILEEKLGYASGEFKCY
jgi:pSer/pThr/pTyr-binding forkhead associated (FHA) protein